MSLSLKYRELVWAGDLFSQTEKFELARLLFGSKPVFRTVVELGKEDQYTSLANELGLEIDTSINALAPCCCEDGNVFSKDVPRDDESARWLSLYIAKNKLGLKTLKEVEYSGTDLDTGKVLGYGECCTQCYSNDFSVAGWLNDIVAPCQESQHLPFTSNVFSRVVYEVSLASDYFPCAVDCISFREMCEESVELFDQHKLGSLESVVSKLCSPLNFCEGKIAPMPSPSKSGEGKRFYFETCC